MNIFFTGGAGFIGSHMTEFLIQSGHSVTVYDNLSTGSKRNLKSVLSHPKFKLIEGDIYDFEKVEKSLAGHEFVIHFCDNSDIQFATQHPETYMNQNVMALFQLLQSMRKHGINKIIFPSSTTVLGDATVIPTPENYGPLKPMNLYGSAKLAAEALISGYAHSFDFQAWIYRFVGIVGPRMDHGVIRDFTKKLLNDPSELKVLGNGKQQRNFLIVEDCIDAIWKSREFYQDRVNLIHIGNTDFVEIKEVAKIVTEVMHLPNAKISVSDSARGWQGDALSNMIECGSLNKMNWKPRVQGSRRTVYEAAKRLYEELKNQ